MVLSDQKTETLSAADMHVIKKLDYEGELGSLSDGVPSLVSW